LGIQGRAAAVVDNTAIVPALTLGDPRGVCLRVCIDAVEIFGGMVCSACAIPRIVARPVQQDRRYPKTVFETRRPALLSIAIERRSISELRPPTRILSNMKQPYLENYDLLAGAWRPNVT
jgi:hypothetical protein